MDGQIEISSETFVQAWETVQHYFTSLELYQMIAWGAIALGLLLVIAGLFLL